MQIPTIKIDRARRRIMAQLVGIVTGSAVALTLVQFGAARRSDDRIEGSGPFPSAR